MDSSKKEVATRKCGNCGEVLESSPEIIEAIHEIHEVSCYRNKPEPVVAAEWIDRAAEEAAEEIAMSFRAMKEVVDKAGGRNPEGREAAIQFTKAIIKSAIERNAR